MSIYSNNSYDKERPNDAWAKLADFIKPDSKVLDIGCSSGQLGMALKKEKHITVVGVDIDKDDVARAKNNLDDAQLLNVEKDSFESLGKFDSIVFADVIEHLYDPVAALRKIKKSLGPDGRVVFSIPNMANVTVRLELLKGRFEYKDFGLLDRTHIHFYDQEEVERVFKEAGFSIIKYDCTIREIPDSILKKELKEIGIELTPLLKQKFNETSGLVYQFVGYAEVSEKPKHAGIKTTSPLDSVSREIDKIRDALNSEIVSLRKGLIQKDKEREHLQNRLNLILNSKGWKTLEKAYKVKSKIIRK